MFVRAAQEIASLEAVSGWLVFYRKEQLGVWFESPPHGTDFRLTIQSGFLWQQMKTRLAQ